MKRLVSNQWPLGHILNPATPYIRKDQSDIRETFDRIRAEQRRREFFNQQNRETKQ